MPQLPIHGDYHQGNLKYQDSRVIGVFDFEWSKIDFRLFDLALPLVYFCACWEGPAAGSLNPDDGEYLTYLNHGHQLMDWIGAQKGRIGDITHQTCT